LDEGKELLEILGIQYSIEPRIVQDKKVTSPVISGLKEKLLTQDLTKGFRSSIMLGLVLYLALLFSSLGIASVEGYKITTHTISELALSNTSPVPILFDFSCIIGGLTSVFFYYLLSKRF